MRSRYGRELELGVFVIPTSDDLGVAREQAAIADELGLDLIGIQDHPYQWRYLETWTLIADLLARTERVRFFPDVANLPLRRPAMLAKQAASLDVLSGGRFELGLGAGAFWDAIARDGRAGSLAAARRSTSLEEAIEIIRALLERRALDLVRGRALLRARGCTRARRRRTRSASGSASASRAALALTGRLADGWVPSLGWATPDLVPDMQPPHRRGGDRSRGAIRRRSAASTTSAAHRRRPRRRAARRGRPITGSRRSRASQPTSASTRSSSGRRRARSSRSSASRGRSLSALRD